MISNKNFPVYVVVIISFFLLNIYSSLLWDIRVASNQLDVSQMIVLHIVAMITCFFFGVLLEWNHLFKFLKNKISFEISGLLLIGVTLFIISLFPPVFFLMEFSSFHMPFPRGGVGINMLFGLFNQFSNVQAILSVTAGTLAIKGLRLNKRNSS